MTKTVLAGKQVKEFSLKKRLAFLAFFYAIFPRFTKNFFMRDRPGDAGNRDSKYKKIQYLKVQ